MSSTSVLTAGVLVVAVPVIATARTLLTSVLDRLKLWNARRDAVGEDRLPENVIDPKSLL
jgi:hypothetical protein